MGTSTASCRSIDPTLFPSTGEERGEGFADDELLRLDGGGEDRFERALLAFSDHGVGGENGGDDGGEDQQVEQ